MNLNESANKWLDKMDSNKNSILITEGVGSNITKIIKTIVNMIPFPKFSAESLKKWISDHADEFEKAHAMYTKALTMRESTMNEGILDMFKGMNKNTLIMLVLIAVSGLVGSATAGSMDDAFVNLDKELVNITGGTVDTDYEKMQNNAAHNVKDLERLAVNIVRGMKIIRVDQTDPRPGYDIDYTHIGGGHNVDEHYRQVIGGIDKDIIQDFKNLAKTVGVDDKTAVNILHYMLTQHIIDSGNVEQYLDGLTAKEFQNIVKASLK